VGPTCNYVYIHNLRVFFLIPNSTLTRPPQPPDMSHRRPLPRGATRVWLPRSAPPPRALEGGGRVAPTLPLAGLPSPRRICLFTSSTLGSSSSATAATARPLLCSPNPSDRPLLPVVQLTNPRRHPSSYSVGSIPPAPLLGSSPQIHKLPTDWLASFLRAHGHARGKRLPADSGHGHKLVPVVGGGHGHGSLLAGAGTHH
jgi:hypothetical protein